MLGLLVAASLLWRLPHLDTALHDDTFISLRYARHLAEGQGLTFNPGERVEGYTNFLWTLLLAALQRLHLDAVRAAPRLSTGLALLLLALVYRFGVRWGNLPGRGWALVAPSLLAVHPMFEAESVGGLETPLFLVLVWIGFERFIAESRAAARPEAWGAALALATLARPEGALVFACLLVARVRAAGGRAQAWRALGVFALLVVPHLVFRLVYYRDLVPNTFHAKVGWSVAQVQRGARYVWEYGLGLSLPASVLALFGLRGGGWRRTAFLVLGVYTLYVMAVGGDFAPTGRFVLVPLLFTSLLAQSALVRLHGRLGRGGAAVAVPLTLLLLAGAWSFVSARQRLESRRWPAGYGRDLAARRFMGRWLHSTVPRDATVAVGSIGAIGYYSDLPILDTFGLTNVEIGRTPVEWMGQASAGHEKGSADAVLRRAPRVILFDRAFLAPRALDLDAFVAAARSPTEQLLVQDPRFYEMYALHTLPSPVGVLHLLERVEAPATERGP